MYRTLLFLPATALIACAFLVDELDENIGRDRRHDAAQDGYRCRICVREALIRSFSHYFPLAVLKSGLIGTQKETHLQFALHNLVVVLLI